MHNRYFTVLGVSALVIGMGAGPLDPPAGPIAPSYKTLTQVQPRTPINATTTPGTSDCTYHITQPGSYYLTENLVGQASHAGIKIDASNVTIDLNGFSVIGAATGNPVDGINSPAGNNAFNIAVMNGVVTGWKGAGVSLYFQTNVRVENITSSNNTVDGIDLGQRSRATNCIANSNGNFGLYVSDYCLVADCTTAGNAASGVYLSNCSKAVRCISTSNTGSGFTCSDNTVFVGCAGESNTDCGFKLAWGCTITGCEALTNSNHGISVGSYCDVENNSTRANSSAGIYATSGTNRSTIRNNACIQNNWGIKVDASVTLVVGNSCSFSGTANYTIVAGNRVGTIVTPPLNTAINGGSGGGSSGVTDPTCNYNY